MLKCGDHIGSKVILGLGFGVGDSSQQEEVTPLAHKRFGKGRVLTGSDHAEIFWDNGKHTLEDAGNFWLLTQVDGMVSGPTSAIVDQALLLAMHTPVTVRCRRTSEWESVPVLDQIPIELNISVPDWECRHAQLQDGDEHVDLI
ncbi:hypothetical protein CYMTET_15594 [Cymbomonas tetramitiformis]|uniref:Uncharacterized protein n=1 Tax=Cymbomonas tetramitiformis TaxID=36881 RepID=A0AAE0GDV8_9CHLO|nr:hypothetical protein CYMTET_15594 [Cymbomonas tetramitiformis]